MSIVSIPFFSFVALGMVVYYLIPTKWQWGWLLTLSVSFYMLAATHYTIIFLALSVLIAWGTALGLAKAKRKEEHVKLYTTLLKAGIVGQILLWFVANAYGLWGEALSFLHFCVPAIPAFSAAPIVSAMGMGYYTLIAVSYMVDCLWEIQTPEKNPLKVFLVVGFFPHMVTGPISRYEQMKQLFEPHRFSYQKLAFGAQRILWGVFKKLVIAERVGVIVTMIYDTPEFMDSKLVWLAFLVYPLQMYADFSGCVDIALGVAEVFGVHLPENFRSPFFSKTMQEFWQRWHITLGTWAKDYILYPVLKSDRARSLGKKAKEKYGKNAGKLIPTAYGMLVLWLALGLWHGMWAYVVGASLWYWLVLVLGEAGKPLFEKLAQKLGCKVKSFSHKLFQCLRTYFLYAVGLVFFRGEDAVQIMDIFRNMAKSLFGSVRDFSMFFDGTLMYFGEQEMLLSVMDYAVLLFSLLLLLAVELLRERYTCARSWMEKQGVVFRWSIWLLLWVLILVFGAYGPGYNAVDFIYQGF